MITVTLRKNDTGEERTFKHEGQWEEHSDYMWTEGNYACDCNRAIFFADAKGEDEPQCVCGDTAYTLVKICKADGTQVYTEKKL